MNYYGYSYLHFVENTFKGLLWWWWLAQQLVETVAEAMAKCHCLGIFLLQSIFKKSSSARHWDTLFPVDNAYLGSSLQNFSQDKASLTMALHESFPCAEPSEFPDGQILDFFGRLWFLVRENNHLHSIFPPIFSKWQFYNGFYTKNTIFLIKIRQKIDFLVSIAYCNKYYVN